MAKRKPVSKASPLAQRRDAEAAVKRLNAESKTFGVPPSGVKPAAVPRVPSTKAEQPVEDQSDYVSVLFANATPIQGSMSAMPEAAPATETPIAKESTPSVATESKPGVVKDPAITSTTGIVGQVKDQLDRATTQIDASMQAPANRKVMAGQSSRLRNPKSKHTSRDAKVQGRRNRNARPQGQGNGPPQSFGDAPSDPYMTQDFDAEMMQSVELMNSEAASDANSTYFEMQTGITENLSELMINLVTRLRIVESLLERVRS